MQARTRSDQLDDGSAERIRLSTALALLIAKAIFPTLGTPHRDTCCHMVEQRRVR